MNATINTTLYTTARSTDEVIEGFLGNMSAGQIVGNDANDLPQSLLNHCLSVDPSNYATSRDALESVQDAEEPNRVDVVAFTCSNIAEIMYDMARVENAA